MTLALLLLACGGDAQTDDSSASDTGTASTADTATDTPTDSAVPADTYACGWSRSDPGTLISTGGSNGDVVDNFQGYDQCEELVDLWDFHGGYTVLFVAAAW
jgi:hypothetical protein